MTEAKKVFNKYKRVSVIHFSASEHFQMCDSSCCCSCSLCGEKLITVTAEADRKIFATMPFIKVENSNRDSNSLRLHTHCFKAFTIMCQAMAGANVSAHEAVSAAKEVDMRITPRLADD
jgi:hypothetical protein